MNYRRSGSTIYDVAKAAGVSPTTVSRVLNDTTYPVSEDVRRRVLDAAAKLNYTARGKLRPTERDVVVMVPNLFNPFYTTLIAGMEATLRMFGLNMLLMNTQGDVVLERRLISELSLRNSVRLIIAPVQDDVSHLQTLVRRGSPIVVIEEPTAENCSTVFLDHTRSGELSVSYMLSRGLTRIAYLGTPLIRSSRMQIYRGYCNALEKAGIGVDPDLVFFADEEMFVQDEAALLSLGMTLAERMLAECSSRPDGVYCSNDMIAIGALRCFEGEGIRVPQDISVASIDNILLSAFCSPPLTTVDTCTYELGRVAAETLYARLLDSKLSHANHVLMPKLVVRDSVR